MRAERSGRGRSSTSGERWPPLASMGFEFIWNELDDIRDACDTIHWWTDQDDETLLNALDGDDEDVWEFKLAFSNLEARADELFEIIHELCRYEDDFGQVYDDCTVALIGNRYQTIGYDGFEEDYDGLSARDGPPHGRGRPGRSRHGVRTGNRGPQAQENLRGEV